jgi:hypothetical protein
MVIKPVSTVTEEEREITEKLKKILEYRDINVVR